MKHSSANSPCPICFRDTDDKCRWNENQILCFYGDSFHPPDSFQKGNIVSVGGVNWKLLKTDSGFANSSYLFVRTEQCENLSPLRQRRIKRIEAATRIEWKQEFNLIRKLLHQSFATIAVENLSLQELRDAKNKTLDAINKCEKLLTLLTVKRRNARLKKYTITALRIWRKQLSYQLKDLVSFETCRLGMPRTY
jgi:hypothetical protein